MLFLRFGPFSMDQSEGNAVKDTRFCLLLALVLLSIPWVGHCIPLRDILLKPTEEQLDAAKKAVEPLGWKLEEVYDKKGKKTIIWFELPKATNDDLKKLRRFPSHLDLT